MGAREESGWIVTPAEMQAPRRVSELERWLESVSNRFDALPPEKIEAVRLGGFGSKRYFGEAVPIARFAIGYYGSSPAVTVQHVLGNQPFDAQVIDERDPVGPLRFIEVTESIDGGAEALRMEKLNREGATPAYGRIEADGPKHRRGEIRTESIAHSRDALREQELVRIERAVAAKTTKRYPDGTALVVLADDFVPLRDDEDWAVLDRFVETRLLPITRQFAVLGVVGRRSLYRAYTPGRA